MAGQASTPAPSPEGDESRLLSWPFVLVMLTSVVYFTVVGALIPAVPQFVEDELRGGGLEVGIGVGSFSVSAVALRPWIGRLGDRHGRRVLTVVGAALAGVSILLYPLATTLPAFVALRLATGAGEAAFFTAVITLSQDLAPGHRRGEAASYFSVSLYGGLAAGPPLGEALLGARGFTPVFVAFGVLALVAATFGTRVPRGIPPRAPSLADPETATAACAATPAGAACPTEGPTGDVTAGASPTPPPGGVVGPTSGSGAGPATSSPAGPAVSPPGSPAAGPATSRVERRAPGGGDAGGDGGEVPGSAPGWLHVPAVWPGIVLALGIVPLTAFTSFLPLYADEIDFEQVGTVLAVYSALIIVVRIVGARLPDALGWWRSSTSALCVAAGGIALLGLWGSAAAVWVGAVTLAVGMSLLFPALLAVLVNSTPDGERSFAVATLMAFFDLSLGAGAALVGGVISLAGQRAGFVFAGLCALGGLAALVALRDRIGGTPSPVPPRPA